MRSVFNSKKKEVYWICSIRRRMCVSLVRTPYDIYSCGNCNIKNRFFTPSFLEHTLLQLMSNQTL